MKRLLTFAGAIMSVPFVRPVAEKFVYSFLKEKTQGTKNPYDDIVLSLVWKFINGERNIEETLRIFIIRMAAKQGGLWSHLRAAMDSYYNESSKQR